MAFPLHDAARRGDSTAVVGLIGQGANLETRDAANRVPLHLAAWAGHLGEEGGGLGGPSGAAMVRSGRELRRRHDPPATHSRPLADCVKALVAAGAQKGASAQDDMNALHFAATKGRAEVARWLLNAGVHVNARTRKGEGGGLGRQPMALACCCRCSHPTPPHPTRRAGETALHLAARAGHRPCCELLLQRKADATARSKRNATAADVCKDPDLQDLLARAAAGEPVVAAEGAEVEEEEAAAGGGDGAGEGQQQQPQQRAPKRERNTRTRGGTAEDGEEGHARGPAAAAAAPKPQVQRQQPAAAEDGDAPAAAEGEGEEGPAPVIGAELPPHIAALLAAQQQEEEAAEQAATEAAAQQEGEGQPAAKRPKVVLSYLEQDEDYEEE